MAIKKILIFDTETIGTDEGKKLIYDLGYTIYDVKNDKVLTQKQYIIDEVFSDKPTFMQAYYSGKRWMYEKMLREGKARLYKFSVARAEMLKDMLEYDIDTLAAYNINFDINALIDTMKYVGIQGKFLQKNCQILDLWRMACQTILRQVTFQKQALEKNLVTASGKNFATNAEITFQYITQDFSFKEEHTALSDTEIELEIFKKCLRQKKKFDFGVMEMPFKEMVKVQGTPQKPIDRKKEKRDGTLISKEERFRIDAWKQNISLARRANFARP